MSESTPFRKFFLLEAGSALAMIGLGIGNLIGGQTGLHSIIALYLLAGGLFLSAVVIRRRKGPPNDLPDSSNGLVKAIEKLAGSKPFGFVCLAIAPLSLGYGGFGALVFLLLYLASVNAMRTTDEELQSWIGAPINSTLVSPKAEATKKSE